MLKKSIESTSDMLEELFSNSPTHVELVVNTAREILIFGHQSFIYTCDRNCLLSHCFETADRNDLVQRMMISLLLHTTVTQFMFIL